MRRHCYLRVVCLRANFLPIFGTFFVLPVKLIAVYVLILLALPLPELPSSSSLPLAALPRRPQLLPTPVILRLINLILDTLLDLRRILLLNLINLLLRTFQLEILKQVVVHDCCGKVKCFNI